MSTRLSIKRVAARLCINRSTLDRLVKDGLLPLPAEAEPRGWTFEELPTITAAVESDRARYRAAQLAAFDKARAVRMANIAAAKAEKAGDGGVVS